MRNCSRTYPAKFHPKIPKLKTTFGRKTRIAPIPPGIAKAKKGRPSLRSGLNNLRKHLWKWPSKKFWLVLQTHLQSKLFRRSFSKVFSEIIIAGRDTPLGWKVLSQHRQNSSNSEVDPTTCLHKKDGGCRKRLYMKVKTKVGCCTHEQRSDWNQLERTWNPRH